MNILPPCINCETCNFECDGCGNITWWPMPDLKKFDLIIGEDEIIIRKKKKK